MPEGKASRKQVTEQEWIESLIMVNPIHANSGDSHTVLEIPKQWNQEAVSIWGGRVPSSRSSKKKSATIATNTTVQIEEEDNQEQDISTTVDIEEGSLIPLACKMLLDIDPNWDSKIRLLKLLCSFTYNTPKVCFSYVYHY